MNYDCTRGKKDKVCRMMRVRVVSIDIEDSVQNERFKNKRCVIIMESRLTLSLISITDKMNMSKD